MAIPILRDLRGMRVQVMHPPDAEGIELVEHLRRIGCRSKPVADPGSNRADSRYCAARPSTTRAVTPSRSCSAAIKIKSDADCCRRLRKSIDPAACSRSRRAGGDRAADPAVWRC